MDLSRAYDVARRGNQRALYEALAAEFADELAMISGRHPFPATGAGPDDDTRLPEAGPKRALPADKQSMARTGSYDSARYASPSEARQAVLAAAAACGWALTDVLRHMRQHSWPGMNAFYARYTSRQRHTAIRRDWVNATAYVSAQRRQTATSGTGNHNGHKNYTSRLKTQGGTQPSLTEHQFLRTWRATLGRYETTMLGTRVSLGYRMLLRALGEAAHKAGSRFIEFGVRSLAVATGTHPTTVARQLRELANQPDAMIRLASEAKGTRGDLYELVIPHRYQTAGDGLKWATGTLHALRPVFYELGLPAAFVYEAIEHHQGEFNSADLARTTGLSTSAVTMALEMLSAWNMIERRGGRWITNAGTSLRQLAEYFGVLDTIAATVRQHRHERALWHAWLTKHTQLGTVCIAPDEDYPFWDRDGPPDEHTTVTGLLPWQTPAA